MCSTSADSAAPSGSSGEPAQPDEIEKLGQEIDELARAARGPDLTAADVADRLARAWDMVASFDPELARRLAGYGT